MFFEQRTQSSIKHRRLKYLALLALRCALLLLLALVFAKSVYHPTANPAARRAQKLLMVAVDNSFSMRAGNALADAKNAGHGSIRRSDPGIADR